MSPKLGLPARETVVLANVLSWLLLGSSGFAACTVEAADGALSQLDGSVSDVDGQGEVVADAGPRVVDASTSPLPIKKKVIVWQHNISGGSAPNAEKAIVHSVEDYPKGPDIYLFQECGPKCVCGDGGSLNATTGRCETVSGASVERGLRNVGATNAYVFRRNGGRVIGFRANRFEQIGSDLNWGATATGDDEFHAACSTVKVGEQLSIMLEDLMSSPRRQILVSTGHWFVGRDCACKQVDLLESKWKDAPVFHNAEGAPARSYVDIHLFGGDWNAEYTSGMAVAYRNASATCSGLDLGGEDHSGTAGETWTFCQGSGGVSNPTGCYNKKKVDYLWARNYNGSGISWVGAVDATANYFNDHRAVRTVFTY